jgi:hypothetical protein
MIGNGMAAFPALDSVSCRTATGHTEPPDEWPILASVLQKRTHRSPRKSSIDRNAACWPVSTQIAKLNNTPIINTPLMRANAKATTFTMNARNSPTCSLDRLRGDEKWGIAT